ncbi:calcium-binding protein [Candidatus Gracilibacteria bacterium]|nr:calcium-binding protein [Candidatus Gracilibacteria bacterium]
MATILSMVERQRYSNWWVGYDTLNGQSGNDSFDGGADNDYLDGGLGNDTLIGGSGNDTYIIDSLDDVVSESSNQGRDSVLASVDYTLGSNLENLTLNGSNSINGTGNELNNTLVGNSGDNLLTGMNGNDTLNGGAGNDILVSGAGNDTIEGGEGDDFLNGEEGNDRLDGEAGNDFFFGGDGNDFLIGGEGNDFLIDGTGDDTIEGGEGDDILNGSEGDNSFNGGAGNDTLISGAGNDTLNGGVGDDLYIIDSIDDVVSELSSQGIDLVIASFDYTLGANVETLTLDYGNAIDGIGNELDNFLVGNSNDNRLDGGAGNDTLDGGFGNDTLNGGAGNDTYYLDSFEDVISETSTDTLEIDTVISSVSYTLGANLENLTLTDTTDIEGIGNLLDNTLLGNQANNLLAGREGNDILNGREGDDLLVGEIGNDTLTGGMGADRFQFSNLTQAGDFIADYLVADDTIVVSANGFGLGAGAVGQVLTESAFHLGSAAADESDRFIYDASNGSLFFDADGTGIANQVQLATLSTGLAMTHLEIFVGA